MLERVRLTVAVAMLFVTAACTDVGVVTNPTVAPLTTTIGPASTTGGDPEPQWPTAIHSLSGDVILPGSDEDYPGDAIVSAVMRYDSYHARLSARANVTGMDTKYHEFYPQETHQFWGFSNLTTHAQWSMYMRGACGNVIELNILGEVWWVYQGGWNVNSNESQTRVTEHQPDCGDRVPPDGGGKGGPTDATYRCYTYTVDHYWYYPDTGEYEFRYTTVETWCEPSSSY